MSSLSVIKHFNVLEDTGFSCPDRIETLGIDQLDLEPTRARLHGGIIPTVFLPAHARHTVPGTQVILIAG